jgi:hypothetical protein
VRLELNASIFKDVDHLVNVMVLGMRTEFRRGRLLKNFIWKTGAIPTVNITTDFRGMGSEDGNEGNQINQVRYRTFILSTGLN